jgi:hypothetical protein
MADKQPWGRPADPPPPEELGDIVTRFQGWIESNGSTPKNYHRFTIGVPAHEKFKALLMADHPGMMLCFEVYLKPKGGLTLDDIDEFGGVDEEFKAALDFTDGDDES